MLVYSYMQHFGLHIDQLPPFRLDAPSAPLADHEVNQRIYFSAVHLRDLVGITGASSEAQFLDPRTSFPVDGPFLIMLFEVFVLSLW